MTLPPNNHPANDLPNPNSEPPQRPLLPSDTPPLSPAAFRPVELLHGGRMRWIREAAFSEGVATARVTIDAHHPFVRGGILLPSALVEVMAQAAAAGSALQATGPRRRVKQGYLVAMRAFAVTAPVVAGASLEIRARHERRFGPLSQATLEVRHGGMVIASARMTFHLEFE